jgi:hypothetical protein
MHVFDASSRLNRTDECALKLMQLFVKNDYILMKIYWLEKTIAMTSSQPQTLQRRSKKYH